MKKKNDTKKRLITTCTHGNETFAQAVVDKLQQEFGRQTQNGFTTWVNNPRAVALQRRYAEADLNRVGPGNLNSPVYEERRAAEVLLAAREFGPVIDIHGSVSNCGVFLILSDANWQNIELAKKLDVARVVLWPSLLPTGPLTQFIPESLEIECGPMSDPAVSVELERVLRRFLQQEPRTLAQQFYIVTGALQDPTGALAATPMQDFVETSYQGQKFTPLLVDQYTGIKCYQLQKLGDTLLSSE